MSRKNDAPTTSDVDWHADREPVQSWCKNCGVSIVYDGENWWHNDTVPEDEPCFYGNEGPEPEYLNGVPINCYRSGVDVVWPGAEAT